MVHLPILPVSSYTHLAKPDSPHHEAMLSSLFSQPPQPAQCFLYDLDGESPEFGSLTAIVLERLVSIFRLHGAVDMEPPLLMPVFNPGDEKDHAALIDRYGDIVTLPNNALVPFARLAARAKHNRIKRYHINNIYRPKCVASTCIAAVANADANSARLLAIRRVEKQRFSISSLRISSRDWGPPRRKS